ncbi:MAG: asparagine synthase-related protein, partial [Planctomycetota bacterium]
MCGIAGILRIHDPNDGDPPPHLESIPEAWLDTLDESIKHRGPDGAGRFRDRAARPDGLVVDVALVHRRLSIIDHAGGHQPMVHDGERLRPDLTYEPGETPKLAHELEPDKPLVAVVFNGCIYNHRELRAELESLGHRFETDHSDTEVLVHGWRAWDLQLLDRLDAMYVCMAWSRSTGQLANGGDHSGEKPLYESCYMERRSRVFCSSITGLAQLQQNVAPEDLKPYLPGIEEWLRHGADWIPAVPCYSRKPNRWTMCPPTPVLSANWTPSGHAIETSPELLNYRRRKLPPRFDTVIFDPMHLKSAITSRLEADVPLGVFLSGGIDSALIAALTKQHRPDIKTFTVRMPEVAYDESQDAAETAAHIGTDHHTLDCEPKPVEDLVMLIEHLGLPFGDSSLLPTYWVSKAAREHVKVALSGDGGDELFGGYRRHTINSVLNRYRHLLRLIPTRLLDRRTPGTSSEYLARLATAAVLGGG